MASTREIGQRLADVMKAAPGINAVIGRYKDDNNAIKVDELPGVIVSRADSAEHDNTSYSDHFTSRAWVVWIVVQEIIPQNPASKEAADDAAEDMIDPIIDYLMQHQTLDYEGDDLVEGITVRDAGVDEYQRAGKRYSAVPILLNIAYSRQNRSSDE